MWHEARKQEKKIRGLMVDYKKRAERRREFYEKIKLDPTQFLRIQGRPYRIHLDASVAIAAESPQSMMPWQDNEDNLIDRFDVRAHLDTIPVIVKAEGVILTRSEDDEERNANYERYRTLVENEAAGLTEEQALNQIYIDEQFGPPDRTAEEQKKKLEGKRVAIGYTYEDSTDFSDNKGDEDNDDDMSDESSDTDVETADLDVTLNVDDLTPEQMVLINQCAEFYGMKEDDFIRLLSQDKDELDALRLAKQLEEEKAQFAGRKSRRERRAFKDKRLQGRPISPPSYAAKESPKYDEYKRSSSSSRSRSRSPDNVGKVMFITSFGGESDHEGKDVVHGPSLPSVDKSPQNPVEQSDKSDSKRHSCKKSDSEVARSRSRSRSRSLNSSRRRRSSSRSPLSRSGRYSRDGNSRNCRPSSRDRRTSDRRSRDRRSISRDRWSSRDYNRRSSRERRSFDRGPHFRERRLSRDRRPYERTSPRRYSDNRRSYSDRNRWSRSRSRSPRRRSRSLSHKDMSSSRSRSDSYSSRSSSDSRSRSKSRGRSRSTSKSRSNSPTRATTSQPLKRYRRKSLSSGTESDEDKNGTSQSVKKPAKAIVFNKTAALNQMRLTPQERLRRKMQAQLNRQYKADKKAETVRTSKVEQERIDREEDLRSRAMEMRRREREKRHKELEDKERDDARYDSDSSSGRSSPRRSRRRRSSSGSGSRSRSRSRSNSLTRGLVSY